MSTNDLPPSFGHLLRYYRSGAGLTQEALAERAQLSVRGIKYLEQDRRKPYDDTVRRLAEALGLGADERTRFQWAARRVKPPTTEAVQPDPDPRILPRLPHPLIGRELAIAELHTILGTDPVRLVTLTGPGGVGKTALALQVATEMRMAFLDGVVFVPLASLADPGLMLPTIADTLGVSETAEQPVTERLRAYLREKRLLLVLDNCEHLLDAVPALAELLSRCPALKVLATSRASLRIRGEREFPVVPLALPDCGRVPPLAEMANIPAVALFMDRAKAIQPGFAITQANAVAVAEICARLDGLPLAIELAAARSNLLAPQAILRRMERSLPLLTDGPRDLPARQRTLRDTIAWSYALLTESEQLLLRRSAAFAGGWTLDGLEAIREVGGASTLDPLNGMASLVDQSMVRRDEGSDGEPRFDMLRTIREFALERLAESDEEAAVRDRHAAYLAGLVECAAAHLESADQAIWLDRLARDDDNIRAALAWTYARRQADRGLRLVRALNLYWFVRGHLIEGYEQTIRFIRLPESAAFPLLCSDALNAAGYLAREYGDYARADEASRESLALSHQLNDRKRAADALTNLGYVALQRGELDGARDLFQRSLATNRELGNRQGIADALSFLALTAFRAHDLDAARRMNEESLAIWESLDDRQATVWARTRLALVLLEQGALATAYDALMTSVFIARELAFRLGLSWCFDGLAHLAWRSDIPDLAVRLAATAVAIRAGAGIRLSPLEQAEHDRQQAAFRAAMGTEKYADAWASVEQWTMDALISASQYAFGTLDVAARPTTSPP